MVIEQESAPLKPAFTAGTVPAATNMFDREITFPAPLAVWTGKPENGNQREAGASTDAAVRVV